MKKLIAVAIAALTFSAAAQEYPSKPIRLIVPLTPGSGADIAGRIIAQRLNEHWKQPVVVENRPGAGGQIGTAAVVKADPDGHTLLVQSSSHAANPAIHKNLPYDPLKDLADVAILGKTPYIMVSAGNGPYKSIKELIGAAKALLLGAAGEAGQVTIFNDLTPARVWVTEGILAVVKHKPT